MVQFGGVACIVSDIMQWKPVGSVSGYSGAGVVNSVGLADEQATQSDIFMEAAVAAIQSNHIFLSPYPVPNLTISDGVSGPEDTVTTWPVLLILTTVADVGLSIVLFAPGGSIRLILIRPIMSVPV